MPVLGVCVMSSPAAQDWESAKLAPAKRKMIPNMSFRLDMGLHVSPATASRALSPCALCQLGGKIKKRN